VPRVLIACPLDRPRTESHRIGADPGLVGAPKGASGRPSGRCSACVRPRRRSGERAGSAAGASNASTPVR
jgi:hypothetical protein